MKHVQLMALLSLALFSNAWAMDPNNNAHPPKFKHAPEQIYPDGFRFIPVDEIPTTLEIIPDEVREEIDLIYNSKPSYIANFRPEATRIIHTSNHTLYFAGMPEYPHNIISSLGYDPYQPKTHPADINERVEKYSGPVIHRCTIAIAQHLLKEQQFKSIKPIPTWLYHIPGKPVEIDDANFALVQQQIPNSFKQLCKLSDQEKKSFFENADLEEIYLAIRTISYAFPDQEHIWINPETHELIFPTPISPDNEGLGIGRKYGKAILGQDAGKAQHNLANERDGGHRAFGEIVAKYADAEQQQVWLDLYENDTQRG